MRLLYFGLCALFCAQCNDHLPKKKTWNYLIGIIKIQGLVCNIVNTFIIFNRLYWFQLEIWVSIKYPTHSSCFINFFTNYVDTKQDLKKKNCWQNLFEIFISPIESIGYLSVKKIKLVKFQSNFEYFWENLYMFLFLCQFHHN